MTLHCRRDHLSPTVHGGKSSSCYHSSYTPVKNAVNYNQTEVEKGLSRFRKYENSTSLLPTIPKISEHSHYQKSYHGHSQEKPLKAQEKQSFFLKLNWALDPTSNYRVPLFPIRKTSWTATVRISTETTPTESITTNWTSSKSKIASATQITITISRPTISKRRPRLQLEPRIT